MHVLKKKKLERAGLQGQGGLFLVQSLAAGEVFLERVGSFGLALFWALFRSFLVLA